MTDGENAPYDSDIGSMIRQDEGMKEMAATIAKAVGHDKTRSKETHRLGSQYAEAEAATWRTFARVVVNADGTGHVTVMRDGELIHSYRWEAE